MLWRLGQKTEEAVKLKTVVNRSFQAGLTGEEWRPKSIVSFTASGPRCGASGPWTSPPAPDQPWSRLPRALLPSSGLRVPSALPFPPVSALRSGPQQHFLPLFLRSRSLWAPMWTVSLSRSRSRSARFWLCFLARSTMWVKNMNIWKGSGGNGSPSESS